MTTIPIDSDPGKRLASGQPPAPQPPPKRRKIYADVGEGKTDAEEGPFKSGLPEEIFLHILSQLSNPQDVLSSRLVCREWQEIAECDDLWNNLVGTGLDIYAKLICSLKQGNHTRPNLFNFALSHTVTKITTFAHDEEGRLYVGLSRQVEGMRTKTNLLPIIDHDTGEPLLEIHCVPNIYEHQKYTADLGNIKAVVDIGGGRVVIGSGDGKIIICDLSNEEMSCQMVLLRSHQEQQADDMTSQACVNDITSLACDKNEQKLFVGFWGGKIEIWDLKITELKQVFSGDEYSMEYPMNTTVVYANKKLYSFHDQRVSGGQWQTKIEVLDLETNIWSPIVFDEPSRVTIRSLAIGHNKCFSAWTDGKIRMLDSETGALSTYEMPEGKSVCSLAFGVKGFVFLGLDSGEVMIWNYSGDPLSFITLSGLPPEERQLYGKVSSLDFDYEEKKLHAAFENGMVMGWNFG